MRCLSNIAAFVLYVYYEDGNVVSAAWPRHGNAAAEEAMQRQMQARAVCWAAPCTACKDAHLVPRESWPKTMPLPIDEFPESFDSALTFGNVSLTIAGWDVDSLAWPAPSYKTSGTAQLHTSNCMVNDHYRAELSQVGRTALSNLKHRCKAQPA